MMKQHEEILRLIESVDPFDTAKMDEIDSRYFMYRYPKQAEEFAWNLRASRPRGVEDVSNLQALTGRCKKYSRCRTTLKAERPKGWMVNEIGQYPTNELWFCILNKDGFPFQMGEDLPTEELAELHAIIQAIAYERGDL